MIFHVHRWKLAWRPIKSLGVGAGQLSLIQVCSALDTGAGKAISPSDLRKERNISICNTTIHKSRNPATFKDYTKVLQPHFRYIHPLFRKALYFYVLKYYKNHATGPKRISSKYGPKVTKPISPIPV